VSNGVGPYALDQLSRFMSKFDGMCDDNTEGVVASLTVQIDDTTFVIEKAADEVPVLVQFTVNQEESK
jgi:hypothetical protein